MVQVSMTVNGKAASGEVEGRTLLSSFLREQLKVIEKELGISKDDRTTDIDMVEARLEGKTVPEAAQKKIDDELQKQSILEVVRLAQRQ